MKALDLTSIDIPEAELDDLGKELGAEAAKWVRSRIKTHRKGRTPALCFEVTVHHDVMTVKAKPLFSPKGSA